jgi:hypothetical protein
MAFPITQSGSFAPAVLSGSTDDTSSGLTIADLPHDVLKFILSIVARNGELQTRLVCRDWNEATLEGWHESNRSEIITLIRELVGRIDEAQYPWAITWLREVPNSDNLTIANNQTPEQIEQSLRWAQGQIMYTIASELPQEERARLREFLTGVLPHFVSVDGHVDEFGNLLESIKPGNFRTFSTMFSAFQYKLDDHERGRAVFRASNQNCYRIFSQLMGPISDEHRGQAISAAQDCRIIAALNAQGPVNNSSSEAAYLTAARQGNGQLLRELRGKESLDLLPRVHAAVRAVLGGHFRLVPEIISDLSRKQTASIAFLPLLWIQAPLIGGSGELSTAGTVAWFAYCIFAFMI